MKIPGLDADFDFELKSVKFKDGVSIPGGGPTVRSVASAPHLKLFLDSTHELIAVAARKSSTDMGPPLYLVVPVGAVIAMAPLPAPAAVVAAPEPEPVRPAKKAKA